MLRREQGSPFFDPRQFSVAQKMSWAANRKCKRTEDVAYCLLGLFDIYMPLQYGEGSRAFVRLQEEILRKTDYHSLFAWTATAEDGLLECQMAHSIFASSPLNFINSGDIVVFHEELGSPTVITTHGVKIHLPVERGIGSLAQTYPVSYGRPVFRAVLNCGRLALTTERRLDPRKLRTFCSEDQRIVLLLAESKDCYRGLQKSRCYFRLATSQHLGVHDMAGFQDPSSYETIFLDAKGNCSRARGTDFSFDRSIFNGSRFTLVYQAALGTENPQGCLPYRVHRAWKPHFETGRWEQRSFSPAKIETFDEPYLQRMEMRGHQLQPLEFWFVFEERRPGVNLAHICLKTRSKILPPDKSSLSFILTEPMTSRTQENQTPCDVKLRVGSCSFAARVYCVVNGIDDVVRLRVEFCVRPRLAVSQQESGGRELVPTTKITYPYAGTTTEGGLLAPATEARVPETPRKHGISDSCTQKRQCWGSQWSE